MTDIAFYILSAIAIWSGWRVFRVDSMIRATFALMVSFICVGAIALLMSADYIGVATVFMMAVEMMVMGLFMVMFMMNPAGLNPMQMVHQYRLSIGAGIVAFIGLTVAVLATDLPHSPLPAGRDTMRDLGINLLGSSMLIFETAGVTLLATMLGAVILSSRRGRFGVSDAGAVPPGLHPGGTPAGRKVEEGGGHGGHGGHDKMTNKKDGAQGTGHMGHEMADDDPALSAGHTGHVGHTTGADPEGADPEKPRQEPAPDRHEGHGTRPMKEH
ncbi:NADH-quinone oxidoreductase subunit J [Sulfitobacter sp.]|uniref:NADH-quinone oxidoreductase subunit J family protein n=1 Tax=Sulfitobacter sp. TaxID=1903071 RepID=UPI003299D146